MTWTQLLTSPTVTAAAMVLGFLFGFFTSRFTMTKSERKNFEQTLFENATKLTSAKTERFQKFAAALVSYNTKKGRDEKLTLDDFQSVADSGTLYFQSLTDIADAIIGGNVDSRSRDNTFVPAIREALNRNIPQYYGILQTIAERIGVVYNGEFRKSDFLSLFEVVEKYSNEWAVDRPIVESE